MRKLSLIVLFSALLLISCNNTGVNKDIAVTHLSVNGKSNPLGIEDFNPEFGWQIKSGLKNIAQHSYRIIVSSSSELIDRNEGDMWDTKLVKSDASQWIEYKGKKLKDNTVYYWKVKSITNEGCTGWSKTSKWRMGLLSENKWHGRWIGLDKSFPWDSETKWSKLSARYYRKQFDLDKTIDDAVLYISGLGLYELYLNGEKVGDQVLAPAPTDYRRRVLYNCFDVKSLLKNKNAIGVVVGNGRYYTMRQNYKKYKIANFGYPTLRLNLIIKYKDGSSKVISTDRSWKINPDGPVRSNNEYDGEIYDARKEFKDWTAYGYDDSKWMNADRSAIPYGALHSAPSANMKVVKIVNPVSISVVNGKYILDMGQNMAGWLKFRVKGSKGKKITLRFAESLKPDGEIYTDNLRDAKSTDIYICNGKENGKFWAPSFVYHGFRYVEISGYKEAELSDFIGEVVSDEMKESGQFVCSDSIINGIYRNAYWGILSNYKGMPVDCPQRNERQPWLGDRGGGCFGESFIFNNHDLYAKWVQDICEAQREDGCIPDVAPAFWNYYSDNVTWPAVLTLACDMLYTRYGDKEPAVKSYPYIKKWLEHIEDNYMNEDHIVTRDRYGDWCVPPKTKKIIHSSDPERLTDGSLISTAYYIKMLQIMQKFAGLQGLVSDKNKMRFLEVKMTRAFNKKFLTVKEHTSPRPEHVLYPDSIYYGNNSLTSNILPLAFDIVPGKYRKDVAENAIVNIIKKNKSKISCGVIGAQWLMKELSRDGFADVAFLLSTNVGYPSWGYMLKNGATTIWELWNGNTANPKMNSRNHVMLLGDLITWYYENLAGIKSDNVKAGFKHIIFKPDFDIPDLDSVDASYYSPYGKISSRWKKSLTHLIWDVEIPANTTAEVHLPGNKIENVGSGSYHYDVEIPKIDKSVIRDEFLYKKASFPQCHASTVVETTNGDILAAFFGGTHERNPDVCIWTCRRTETGWTAPRLVADGIKSPSYREACWNPVLFQIPDGDLLLFYKTGVRVSAWKGWMLRSKDGGKTWSKPIALPDGFIGPSKDKPVYSKGRIICPSSTEGHGWRIHFELSDDNGKTWKMVGPIKEDSAVATLTLKKGLIDAIQPSIIIHKDGTLQILCRTKNAKIAEAFSHDNGSTWSTLKLSKTGNNQSGLDAVTLNDGSFLLVCNDFETIMGTKKGPRTPLSVLLSNDGENWKHFLTLEDSPINQYSYPAVIQGKDGKIHIVYTWRRTRIKYVELDNKFVK